MHKTNLKFSLMLVAILISAFEIKAQPGHIQVACDPGITVFLDELYKGKTNADMGGLVIENVTAGSHTIKLVKDGFKPLEEKVLVKSGEVFLYKPKSFVAKSQEEINASIPKENKVTEQTTQSITNSTTQPDGTTEIFSDTRDGKTYKIVKIGGQTWMAENLAYKPTTSSGLCWAYDNDHSNIAKYGYLYDWQTAKNACPTGWHLPSKDEVKELLDFVDKDGRKLKSKSGWRKVGFYERNGTDDYGFSGLPGGTRPSSGDFSGIGVDCDWWTSTEKYGDNAIYWHLQECIFIDSYWDKSSGLYVRCLKD